MNEQITLPMDLPEEAPVLEPVDVVRTILRRYGVFDANDRSEGFHDRLQLLLTNMDAHRDQIEAALIYTPGTHTYDQILAMVLQGQLALWPLASSFMLTEIHEFPNCRHFHIFLAGGNLEDLVSMHPDVIQLAKAAQCEKLTLAGRPGWERALKRHDWRPYLVTLAKDI